VLSRIRMVTNMISIDPAKLRSARSVAQSKKDARRMSRETGCQYAQALDAVARRNWGHDSWSECIQALSTSAPIEPVPSPMPGKMHPLRKLVVLGTNELIKAGKLSLAPPATDIADRNDSGHIFVELAGKPAVVLWTAIGFGEVQISVWWDYDHSKHPQAELKGACRESFQTSAPLAKRQHLKKFVGIVVSAWLERKEGPHLQGKGEDNLFDRYVRRGEIATFKALPDPIPMGYKAEGKFFM